MRHTLSSLFALALVVVLTLNGLSSADDNLTGYGIMEKYDARIIPHDMTAVMTMTIVDRKGRSLTREVKNYRLGDDRQIMWFLKPADVKGSGFLRISHEDRDDDMWLYLPAFGKVRRIASHARNGNFMGSDFTYEDMGDWKLNDYTFRLTGEDEVNGDSCWIVESIPKEGVSTDYSKQIFWIRKDNYHAVKKELYDRKGNLRKVMEITLGRRGKYWVAERIIMENLKRKGSTRLDFNDIMLDQGVDEEMFKSSQLTRIH